MITSDRLSKYHFKFKDCRDQAEEAIGASKQKVGVYKQDGFTICVQKSLLQIAERPWILGLERILLKINPDLVNVDGVVNFSSFRCAKLKRKLSYKLVYDDHMYWGNSLRHLKKAFYPVFKCSFSKFLMRRADKIVAICEDSKDFMIKNYGFNPNKISIVYLGADTDVFKFDISSRNKVRSELGINDEDIVFLYSGKIFQNKGVHLLIDAALRLSIKYPFLKVILIGYGAESYIERLNEKIRQANCTEKIKWVRWQKKVDLYKYYSAGDVAVWPVEATASVEEAMSCGLVPILPDNLKRVKTIAANVGVTFKTGSLESLISEMENLLLNHDLRNLLRANCIKVARSHLDWGHLASEFIAI